MNRKISPDNQIRRVMDAGLPGLEDDPWFEERVLRRIRATERKAAKARPRRYRGLAVAMALVLFTAASVAAALRGPQREAMIVAASLPEGDEPGFTEVTVVPSAKPASGYVCEFERQSTRQECYQYYDAEQDILGVRLIDVCRLCGRTGGFSFSPYLENILSPHDWVVRDYHRGGTTTHVFYQECTKCHARWDISEIPCATWNDIHIDPRYYTDPYWRNYYGY